MNGLNTKVDVNIILLGSYDFLIGMDWLEKHHVVLDCYNKKITCLDEEGKQGKVQGIPRVVVVREISAMQLKKSFRKGCHIFASHMEEQPRDKMPSIEDHQVLRDFEDVFGKSQDCHQRETLISLLIWCQEFPQCPRHLTEWAHQN
jgi:hypothetical protein